LLQSLRAVEMSLKDVNAFYTHQRDNHLIIQGDEEQSVRLYLQSFFSTIQALPTPRCIDLLRIAVAIFGVDRIVKRRGYCRAGNPNGVRTLNLTIEVEDVEFWRKVHPRELIEEILTFLTDENWIIEFTALEKSQLSTCYQAFLDLPDDIVPNRAALYSGGLDSAAGLANQLIKQQGEYLLITVGHHPGLRKRVNRQISGLAELLGKHTPQQAILVTHLRGGAAKRLDMQETSQRSRAFLFCTTAAIAANAFGIKSIDVFENGAGAINFPLTSEMLNSGLATRGAHPAFLTLMSELVTLVTESNLTFELPFYDRTKGELLSPLKYHGLDAWLQSSSSCIHTSLRAIGRRHCGVCPACIERRQAFLVAGITENISDYKEDIFSGGKDWYLENEYFRIFQEEANAWLRKEPHTLQRMYNHLRITEIPETEDERIYRLQDRHAEEVSKVFSKRVYASDYSNLRSYLIHDLQHSEKEVSV